jgi:7-cyano-7-deazaguanine synthase
MIARRAGVLEHRFFALPGLSEASDIRDNKRLAGLPPTFIPMKNAIYYSVAASYAEENQTNYIIGGHNKDDTLLFEDTSDEFFRNLQATLWSASRRLRERRTTILRPLQHMSKAEVVSTAANLKVPFELTWSCHRDGTKHCWKCRGCIWRTRAFKESGIRDPLFQ